MAAVPGYAGTKTSACGLYSGGGHGSGREHRPSFQSSVFSIEEILTATSNFSPALKIGQGGFGAVYKVISEPSHSAAPSPGFPFLHPQSASRIFGLIGSS